MKILLINPPYSEVYSKVSTAAGVSPPLGLAYIAAYLRKHGIKVEIIDAEASKIGLDELHKHISNDFDVVGVGSMTPAFENAISCLKIAKSINLKCVTVMGGPHISAIPIETLQENSVIDIGVIGEGEITFLELVTALENGIEISGVDGIVFRKNGQVLQTKPRQLIENLDEIPFPAYDLLPMDKYKPPAHHTNYAGNIKLKPFFLMVTSRGCPYNCTFCASKVVWGKTVRYRSADNVLEEIDILINKYGIKCLEFADDNFLINKKRMNKILDELAKKDDFYFNCLGRVDLADEFSINKLKEAGCYLIRFGVESGSQKILDNMRKKTKVEQIKTAFKIANKSNLPASASMIIGHPGETKKTFDESIKLLKEINPVAAHFFIAIPIVGTELFDIVKEKDLIVNTDWKNWVQMPGKPAIRTEELSDRDLLKLRKKAYVSFYFRPFFILKTLIRIRTWGQIKYYSRGFSAVLNLIRP